MFLPIFTISPEPSCPNTTGIRENGSPLYSCTSVPQIPQPSTFISISSSDILGRLNSLTSIFLAPVKTAAFADVGTVPLVIFESLAPFISVKTCFIISSILTLFISIISPLTLLKVHPKVHNVYFL